MFALFHLLAFITGFLRIGITPVKPGPGAIGDPILGVSGQNGAMPDMKNISVIAQALSTNASPAFGNWSQTLIPATPVAATYNANNIVGGIIRRFSPGAAFTDCTDTATNIVNAIPGAVVNQSFPLIIANLGSGAMTLAGGTGVTIAGTAAIASATARLFLGQVTGSAAVTLTNCFGWNLGTGGTLVAGL